MFSLFCLKKKIHEGNNDWFVDTNYYPIFSCGPRLNSIYNVSVVNVQSWTVAELQYIAWLYDPLYRGILSSVTLASLVINRNGAKR